MEKSILSLFEVSIWAGIAAVGFGILFNIPRSAILTVFILGLGAGIIKFTLMELGVNIILASFFAATFVGILSMPMSHRIHQPPVVFSIPAVIPMIPGYFAYETVLSIMNFTFMESDSTRKIELIDAIFTNGFTMFFILITLTIGVSFPMLMMRKNRVKKMYD